MTLPGAALGYDRLCSEITAQTEQLRACARNADLRAPVPSCPEWNLGQLLRHVGGAHGWAETIVRTRATAPVSDEQVNDVFGFEDEDPAVLDAWLAEGAAQLAGALRAAGPEAVVWTASEGKGSTAFWARRMAHETAVHRADVALTVGAEFTLAGDMARDGLDEWMAFAAFPEAYGPRPDLPGLLGPGRTLRFHATDAGEGWYVDLTGEVPAWRRYRDPDDHAAEAAATVHGPLAGLLLLLYRRPAPDHPVRVHGDADLLDLWLRRSGFWLQ